MLNNNPRSERVSSKASKMGLTPAKKKNLKSYLKDDKFPTSNSK